MIKEKCPTNTCKLEECPYYEECLQTVVCARCGVKILYGASLVINTFRRKFVHHNKNKVSHLCSKCHDEYSRFMSGKKVCAGRCKHEEKS